MTYDMTPRDPIATNASIDGASHRSEMATDHHRKAFGREQFMSGKSPMTEGAPALFHHRPLAHFLPSAQASTRTADFYAGRPWRSRQQESSPPWGDVGLSSESLWSLGNYSLDPRRVHREDLVYGAGGGAITRKAEVMAP
jgi:hypothetical protein